MNTTWAQSRLLLVLSSTGALLTGACNGPKTTEDHVGPLNSITTQADVRSFYVKSDKELSDYGRFVAEPPPDVFANLTESLSLLAKASEVKGAGAAELEMISRITKEAVRLGVRSQGVMYLRDASYRLAEGYMNGAFLPLDKKTREEKGTVPTTVLAAILATMNSSRPKGQHVSADSESLIQGLTLGLSQNSQFAAAALEALNYRATFNLILNNAQALILKELEVNPHLSAEPELGASVSISLPRLTADFSTKEETTTVEFTFTNKELGIVDVNLDAKALGENDAVLKSATLDLRLDADGRGTTSWVLPAKTVRVEVVAPTSSKLSKALPVLLPE